MANIKPKGGSISVEFTSEVNRLFFGRKVETKVRENAIKKFASSEMGKGILDAFEVLMEKYRWNIGHKLRYLTSDEQVEENFRITKDFITKFENEVKLLDNVVHELFYLNVSSFVGIILFSEFRSQCLLSSSTAAFFLEESIRMYVESLSKYLSNRGNLNEFNEVIPDYIKEGFFLNPDEIVSLMNLLYWEHVMISLPPIISSNNVNLDEMFFQSVSILSRTKLSPKTKNIPLFLAQRLSNMFKRFQYQKQFEKASLLLVLIVRVLGEPKRFSFKSKNFKRSYKSNRVLEKFFSSCNPQFLNKVASLLSDLGHHKYANYVFNYELKYGKGCLKRCQQEKMKNNEDEYQPCLCCAKLAERLSRICILEGNMKEGLNFVLMGKKIVLKDKTKFDLKNIAFSSSEKDELYRLYSCFLHNEVVCRSTEDMNKMFEENEENLPFLNSFNVFQEWCIQEKKRNKSFKVKNLSDTLFQKQNINLTSKQTINFIKQYKIDILMCGKRLENDEDNKRMVEKYTRHVGQKTRNILRNKRKGRKCDVCWRTDLKILKCSGCMKAEYCSVRCHKRDWKVHKGYCGTWKENITGMVIFVFYGLLLYCVIVVVVYDVLRLVLL